MNSDDTVIADERAVNPAAGVILIVAITVALTAVIGAFVLGAGEPLRGDQQTAQLSVDVDDAGAGSITVERDGRDAIEPGTVRVIVSDVAGAEGDVEGTITNRLSAGDTVSAGFDDSGGTTVTDIRVRAVHEPSGSVLLDRTVETDGVGFDGLADLS